MTVFDWLSRNFVSPSSRRNQSGDRTAVRAAELARSRTLYARGYQITPDTLLTGRFWVWSPGPWSTTPTCWLQLWRTGDPNQPYAYRCSCPFCVDEERLTGSGWCEHGEALIEQILGAIPYVSAASEAPLLPDAAADDSGADHGCRRCTVGSKQARNRRGGVLVWRGVSFRPLVVSAGGESC